MTASRNCPVCDMSVADDRIALNYRGLEFWFCSRQCYDRFKQMPNLYISDPKHGKAAKQRGETIEKQRTFRFVLPENKITQDRVVAKLNSLMGVNAVKINPESLEIEYDLIQVSCEDIENALREMDVDLASTWLDKLHYALIHFSEENLLSSLKHPSKKGGCH